ncbi:hypothetical protein B0H12DRAFT_1111255 [Mycena haematopus]|nr:hypothetical protein B0H12DRAFT_1111255 [Mycena haematopus]
MPSRRDGMSLWDWQKRHSPWLDNNQPVAHMHCEITSRRGVRDLSYSLGVTSDTHYRLCDLANVPCHSITPDPPPQTRSKRRCRARSIAPQRAAPLPAHHALSGAHSYRVQVRAATPGRATADALPRTTTAQQDALCATIIGSTIHAELLKEDALCRTTPAARPR